MNAVDLSTLFSSNFTSCTVTNCNTKTTLGLKRLPEAKASTHGQARIAHKPITADPVQNYKV